MNYRLKMNKRYLVRHLNYIRKNILNLLLPVGPTCHISSLHLSPIPLPPPSLLLSPVPSLLSPGLPFHCPSSHNRRTDRTKKNNIQVHSATSYLIFQYLQYWYYQYFLESSSICNTGITSIFQNLPVSALLVYPVFPRIFRYLQYSYFGNDQYLLVLQILENSGRYWDTSIYQ